MKIEKYIIPSLIIFILLVGLTPRVIELFNNFDYLTPEPSIDYISSKKIIVDHKFPTDGYAFGGKVKFAKVFWDFTTYDDN